MTGDLIANWVIIAESLVARLATLLEPVLSVFTSMLVIMIGGLLSWRTQRWWTKPVLETGDSGTTPWRPHNLGNTDVYRVPIKNSGRRAAKNCKAQMFVEFTTDTARYEVEATLPWEGEQGIRTTINPDEVSHFNILAYDESNDMLSIPSSDSMDNDGLILQYPVGESDEVPAISTKISPKQINGSDIDQMSIKVTAENTASVSSDFNVSPDGIVKLD